MSEAKHSPLLPLAYTDGPDYCTVNDAAGNAFALTVQPAALREMEYATSLHHELVAALEELHAMVRGECPSLLNEDSGGNGRLDVDITDLLQKAKQGDKQ